MNCGRLLRRGGAFVPANHLVWQERLVRRAERERRNGHQAAILWLTGLPAAGKTTIAFQLEQALFARGVQTYALDGDNVRHGLNRDLGFSPAERRENVRRVGELAALFMDSGCVVLASFISPYQQERDAIRQLVPPGQFVEIFVDCPLAVCETRDPKGHYRLAREGVLKEFTGVGAPYEAPTNPELHLYTDQFSPEQHIKTILTYLIERAIIPADPMTRGL